MGFDRTVKKPTPILSFPLGGEGENGERTATNSALTYGEKKIIFGRLWQDLEEDP